MSGQSGTCFRPQVKICGLTRVDQAIDCVRLGADAIGLVFYPPSPRFVSGRTAREICMNLPAAACSVGVFVNEPAAAILKKVEECGLNAVQLHGAESTDTVEELKRAGILVIKTLFMNRTPALGDCCGYGASAFLVEGGGGPLPGGNALSWNWVSVREFLGEAPCILAGGLNAGNVIDAVEQVFPDAVDVSSGVESEPGIKDMDKVETFLRTVCEAKVKREPRRIF